MKIEENTNDYLPLRDVVFNTLRESILKGEMKPGERLMEIHLANKLGVSRTPIREAIRKLELEGLVTMIPRRGAEVAQITAKGLRDVLEVRQALDALAMELACERISEEEIRALREACDPVCTGHQDPGRSKDSGSRRCASRYYCTGEPGMKSWPRWWETFPSRCTATAWNTSRM